MRAKDYSYYNKAFENKYVSGNWRGLEGKANITLLIGAGATSCLVGNWNELLNELAVMKGAADNNDSIFRDGSSSITPQNMLDYLDKNCEGKFLADEISTLEKGEYLRYDSKDQRLIDLKEKRGQWRETVFADRVSCALNRLIQRHLCDGAYTHKKSDYRSDFLNWCRNTTETPFKLRRKDLSKNDVIENQLCKLSADELSHNLNDWYGIDVDASVIESLICLRRAATDPIYKMFSNLFQKRSGEFFKKQIESTLSHKDLNGKTSYEQTVLFLAKIASILLWRPGYDTLRVLLSMCINGYVTRVITYNFDTIFDRLLVDPSIQKMLFNKKTAIRKIGSPLNACVYGIKDTKPYNILGFGSSSASCTLPIYHVHGVIDERIEKLDPIIFSETAYISYQQLLLNQGSIQVANACNDGDLLCVGFSGSDPNFRNIIRQLIRQHNTPVFYDENRHSIYLTRSLDEVKKYYRIQSDMPSSDYEVAFRCASTFIDMSQSYFQHQVNVKILWSKNYNDMAKNIKKTFKL